MKIFFQREGFVKKNYGDSPMALLPQRFFYFVYYNRDGCPSQKKCLSNALQDLKTPAIIPEKAQVFTFHQMTMILLNVGG